MPCRSVRGECRTVVALMTGCKEVSNLYSYPVLSTKDYIVIGVTSVCSRLLGRRGSWWR